MSEDGSGRFIACKAGFYDPAIFLKNRELTVLGRIDGYESRKIGEYDYRHARRRGRDLPVAEGAPGGRALSPRRSPGRGWAGVGARPGGVGEPASVSKPLRDRRFVD